MSDDCSYAISIFSLLAIIPPYFYDTKWKKMTQARPKINLLVISRNCKCKYESMPRISDERALHSSEREYS